MPDPRIAITLEPLFDGGDRVILQSDRSQSDRSQSDRPQSDRSQTLIPNLPSLEAVLIMESRPSRFSGSQVMWTQMYQAGNFHLNLNFQSTPSGGTLHGQVMSLNRLKLEHNRITASHIIGTARLETEFGQLEADAGINANGDFEIVLDQPVLYPLTLRLVSQHGLDVSVADISLY